MKKLTQTLGRGKFSRLRAEDLAVVAAELQRIERAEGEIRPERLVDLAEDPSSPLHRFIFRESDEACARKWRIEEARRLCRAVRIVFVDDEGEEQGNCPSLVSVRSDEATGETEIRTRRYVSIERAYADPEIRRTMIEDALAEADAWAKRHENLVELAPVFRAIESARNSANRRRSKAS